jgi:ATP-dependent Clp protease ATP-binding subunit ClpA
LAKRLDELESRLDTKLVGHDKAIASILAAIRQLMAPVPPSKRGIGFTADIDR